MSHKPLTILDSKSNANITTRGNALFTASLFDQVGVGDIPGTEIIHKFGYGAVASTSLVPVCSNFIYQTPTTAKTLEILSDDANDTAAGTGARTVKILGIGSDWLPAETTVTMDGTTPAVIDTDFLRVYRAFIASCGTYATQNTGSHAGTITIREQGGGADWAEIPIVDGFPMGQTTIGAYTVPTGKHAILLYKNMYVESNRSVDLFFFRRQNADQVTAPFDAMRVLELEVGLVGKSDVSPRSPIGPIVGPADVGFLARVSAGTSNVSVDFELFEQDD